MDLDNEEPGLNYRPRRGRGASKKARAQTASPAKPVNRRGDGGEQENDGGDDDRREQKTRPAPEKVRGSPERWAEPERELDAYRRLLEEGSVALVQATPHIWIAEVYNVSQEKRLVSACACFTMQI